MNASTPESFYVIAYEPGAEHPALPTWANQGDNPLALAGDYPCDLVQRIDVPEVPGAYKLLNVLSAAECQRLIELSEALGYLPDAAVSLPREIRHNDNVVWISDTTTDDCIWRRVVEHATQQLDIFQNKRPLGLNARFRFYRYQQGDYFKPHTDGSWPGSRVIDGELITNAYSDRFSLMTFLIFLNDDFTGGATRFLVPRRDGNDAQAQQDSVRMVDVRVPRGGVLCFPHGMHPMHCVHSSEPIQSGVKYIIRTDMLFEL